MDRRWADTLLTAAAPAAWGSTYLVTTELLPPDRPMWSGVIRALPAGLLLLALTRHRPHGTWWWRAAVLGALNIGAFFPLLFLAAYRLPGGTAAVLGATQPLLVAGLTVLVLAERPRPRALAAALAALAGVTLVVLRPGAGLDPVGIAAGLAATAAMGAGLVLTRRWGRPPGVGTATATGWQLTAGGLLAVPPALLVEGPPPTPDLPALAGYAWLALAGTALAYTLWFRGAARLPVTQVSLLGALSPLTAAALGWAVLGQAMAAWQLTGFVLAVGATVAGQLPPRDATGRRALWRPAARRPGSARRPGPRRAAGQSRGPGWRGMVGSIRRAPGASSPAAASGSVKRAAAAGPAAYDSRSIQRTSSAVQPSPERPAISRSRRNATRVSSS
ncbi:EamA family transporter [Micromonospora deserti]|uniref:EamA family transporter n=1 Tax=Micromonospora deserti TaxID=2070366 RepID=A0A2W2CPJ1_9ACTN|nr:EamA family transporter [Micromonospora deserti]